MKTPLVLLSGLVSNSRVWQHQVESLSSVADPQVITSTASTPEEMVASILDQAPQTFALAGHSMGGWLCLEVMRVAPERVEKLCLINTTARSDSPEKAKRRKEMITRAERGEYATIARELALFFVRQSGVLREVERMFLQEGKGVFINQEKAMLVRDECFSILPTIQCPTLVIHAKEDPLFSLEEHQELQQGISGAKLCMVADSGHMSPMEIPQAITSLLEQWLTE